MSMELPRNGTQRAPSIYAGSNAAGLVSGGWFDRPGAWRTGAWLTLAAIEVIVALVVSGGAGFLFKEFYARAVVFWAIASAIALALIVWPQRSALIESWRSAQTTHDPRSLLRTNLSLFAGFVAAAGLARVIGGTGAQILWFTSLVLLAGAAAALVRLDVPLATSLRAAKAHGVHMAIAICAGLFTVLLAKFSQLGWEPLAGATLDLTHAILSLYETDVTVRHADYYIKVGKFEAVVEKTCSGYEGVGLVSAFLAIFIGAFRKTLRFPHAFLLFPLGIAVVWVLNSVRIAALISLGAHVSPQIAVDGFHSQAGWITFLATSIGLIALAQTSRFFTAQPDGDGSSSLPRNAISSGAVTDKSAGMAATDDNGVFAHLVPLMALLATTMVMSAAQPHGHPLYILKVVAIGAALWYFRHAYAGLWRAISTESVIAGVVVGVVWIATAPVATEEPALKAWLVSQSAGFAVLWLTFRAIGTIVLVPVAEELAFRGFLYRWIISREYETVSYAAFSWVALIGSSVLFGLMHGRLLSAALAGAVFALVMVRQQKLGGAIYAHAIANAVIFFWALAVADWSLL